MARQATLVACYGAKSLTLARLITLCSKRIVDTVGEQFSPYQLDQIHATVVGLEHAPGSALSNLNFQRYRRRSVEMDLPGFLDYLLSSAPIPFSIQIGGFADRGYPFTSRRQRPYKRSFSIQGDKVVLMGWPRLGQSEGQSSSAAIAGIEEAQLYPSTLNEIRLAAQQYGILHAYHRDPLDVDNDFYFRIGLLNPPVLAASTRRKLEVNVRQLLGTEHPAAIEVGLSDLYVASYDDDALPKSSTRVWPVASLRRRRDVSVFFTNES